ncbi:Ribosomal RNA-processing protein [Schistosoma japonicum]|uniref:Ribosomal RNA-processing protein 8 n=1 Tax=Schistosoma japonicum TaxID=6182 RepID=A0A4Z2DXG5_SCHJA|nr:Ribosomal RNA-processing protein [Schistosoma japonicum]
MTKFNLAKLRKILTKPQKKRKIRSNKSVKDLKFLKHVKKNSFDSLINSSMFRFLNERLYTCTSEEAAAIFREDPESFKIYHEGYQQQLSQWPEDPLIWVKSEIIKEYSDSAKTHRIADLGCGDARLSCLLPDNFKVYSFDLVSLNDRVIACDMAHTPLKDSKVDSAVFCLSLMGTNCSEFLYEANRILKSNGILIVVDVNSRFDGKFGEFLKKLKRFGFIKQFSEITSDTYFVRAILRKVSSCTPELVHSLPKLNLKPCSYKKR